MSPPPAPASSSFAMEVDGDSKADKASKAKASGPPVDETAVDPFASTYNSLLLDVSLFERSVQLKDFRVIARVLRSSARLRRSFHSSSTSSSTSTSTSSSAEISSLAAFFAFLRCLWSSPSSPSSSSCFSSSRYSALPPPLCLRLIESELVPKDEAAAEAWAMATVRLAELQSKEGKEEGKRKSPGKPMEVEGGGDDTKEGAQAIEDTQTTTQTEELKAIENTDTTTTAETERVGCVEVCIYMDVLFGLYSLDGDYYEDSSSLFLSLVHQVNSLNRRTVDLLSAKVFYFFALSVEKGEEANKAVGGTVGPHSSPLHLSSILPLLLSSYRSACLQHNAPGQAVLINAILRVHLLRHDFALADTFRLKSSYPSDLRLISSAVYSRYCFYVGKILCIQLAYSDAFTSLQQARRKAPQHRLQAVAFKYQINVLAILTQLLMGEIPERVAFNEGKSQQQHLATITALTRANSLGNTKTTTVPHTNTNNTTQPTQTSSMATAAITTAASSASLPSPTSSSSSSLSSSSSSSSAVVSSSSQSLYPYLCLTRAVRVGDLATFHAVTSRYSAVFIRDDVSSLISRLRHNVIKAGLRKVNLSYSAIPMSFISSKLSLESDNFASDGEALVVKAISDGVIEAKLDPLTAALHSAPTQSSYASSQPQHAFHRRIAFAMEVFNDSVKQLTFPSAASRATVLDSYNDDDDEDEESLAAMQRKEKREREKAEDKERKEKEKEDKRKKDSK